MPFNSTKWIKYTATDITADDSATTEVSASLPLHSIDVRGFRSARIRFYVDADNATVTDVTVYFVYMSTSAAHATDLTHTAIQYHTKQFCQLVTMRGGTVTGVAGGNATAGENYCGVVGTNTTSAWGTALLNYVTGTVATHDVDDEIGELLISDMANADYIHLQFDVGTATLVNAEVHLDT